MLSAFLELFWDVYDEIKVYPLSLNPPHLLLLKATFPKMTVKSP